MLENEHLVAELSLSLVVGSQLPAPVVRHTLPHHLSFHGTQPSLEWAVVGIQRGLPHVKVRHYLLADTPLK